MEAVLEKTCPRCEQVKSRSEFYTDKSKADGLYYMCKDCKRVDDRARRNDPVRGARGRATYRRWRQENRDRVALQRRQSMLRRRYGITLEAYEELLLTQSSKCAICGSTEPDKGGRADLPEAQTFCVDHDHETGAVRGLLCHPCNRGLGQFGDNIELLEQATLYLRVRLSTSSTAESG